MVSPTWKNGVDEFTLDQAAYLWCELDPPARWGEPPAEVYAARTLLSQLQGRDASERTTYLDQWGDSHSVSAWGPTMLKRADLRALAERVNMRPTFLFPPEEPAPANNLHPKERQTAHKVIAALMQLYYGDDWGENENSEANRLLEDASKTDIDLPDYRAIAKFIKGAKDHKPKP